MKNLTFESDYSEEREFILNKLEKIESDLRRVGVRGYGRKENGRIMEEVQNMKIALRI